MTQGNPETGGAAGIAQPARSGERFFSVALWVVFALFALSQYLWLRWDQRPLVEEHHFIKAAHIAHALRGDAMGGEWPDYAHLVPYPPFVVHYSAAWLALFGCTADGAILTLLPFAGLLLWATWKVARYWLSPPAAFTATLLLLAFHHFAVIEPRFPPYTFLKSYLLDLPLSALVAATLYFLLALLRDPRPKYEWLLGLAVGLGALTKITYPLYLLIAGAALQAEGLRALPNWKRFRRPLLLAAAIAAPWYLRHLGDLWRYFAEREFQSDWAMQCGMPEIGSVTGWLYYQEKLRDIMTQPMVILTFMVVLVLVLSRRNGARLLGVGLTASYLILSCFYGKSERVMAPSLLYAALACGALVDLAPLAALRGAIAISLIGFAAYRMVWSHGWIAGFGPGAVRPPLFESAPVRQDWSLSRIMTDILRHREPTLLLRVGVVPYLGYFGHHALLQYAHEHNVRMAGDPGWRLRTPEWQAELERCEFILTKDGDNGLARFTPYAPEIERWVAARTNAPLSLLGLYPLPDGSTARLYRQTPVFSSWQRIPAAAAPATQINFADRIRLSAWRLSREGRQVVLECDWRCAARIKREYRFFVQLRRGRRTLYDAIFQPGAGALPVDTWEPGMALRERYALTLPPEIGPEALDVWIGWFRGYRRLPVRAAVAPVVLNAVRLSRLALDNRAGQTLESRGSAAESATIAPEENP
jgi:4-amino-4-deoxy-L-arabinose transferase-like glycosyltransferase